MQNLILNFGREKWKSKMIEKFKQENFIRNFSIVYLIVFCILKILALTNVFENLPINTIMFIIGCIIMLCILMKNKGKINYSNILILFIMLIIIGMFSHGDVITVKANLFEIFYILVIYTIAKEFFKEQEYIKLVKIILIMTLIMVSIFFIQYIMLFISNGISGKGAFSHIVFSNINGGAILVLLNIIMAIYMYKIKKMNKLLAIFLISYYTVFIVISKARTSQLALVIVICYLIYNYFFRNNSYIKLKKILQIILTISIIVIIIFSLVLVLKRDYDFSSDVDEFIYFVEKEVARFTTLRYWLWKYSIQELVETNPLFGLGANFGEENFQNITDSELVEALSNSQQEILSRTNLHNGYVQILVVNGILAFACIIIFLIMFLFKIFKNNATIYNKYIRCIYIIYIFVNLFENDIILSNTFFVLFLWMHIGIDSNLIENNNINNKLGEE